MANRRRAVFDRLHIFLITEIQHLARAPLREFFHWLQAPCKTKEIDGDRRNQNKVAELVWTTADELLCKFERLTHVEPWLPYLIRCPEAYLLALPRSAARAAEVCSNYQLIDF